MLSRLARHARQNAVAYLALFVALGGTSFAAATVITGKDVKNSSLTGADVKNSSLTGGDVKNKSLAPADFNGSVQGPQGANGPQGATGPQGPKGDPGANGTDGQNGSPDTAAQVRDKLTQVDGAGSGVDADSLDGLDSGEFARGHTFFSGRNILFRGNNGTVSAPHFSVLYECPQTASNTVPGPGTVRFRHDDGPFIQMTVLIDRAGAAPTRTELSGGQTTGETTAAAVSVITYDWSWNSANDTVGTVRVSSYHILNGCIFRVQSISNR